MGVITSDDDNDRRMARRFIQAVTASSEPRYTLADFRELAREYADERHCEAKLAVQLALSCFCEWIQRREQSHGTSSRT